MWWAIGIGVGVFYLILLFTAGVMTLRKGHWLLFFAGIFFPLLWLIGIFTEPRRWQPV